jgi:hypothetical protein
MLRVRFREGKRRWSMWPEWACFGLGFLVGLAVGTAATYRFCLRTFKAQFAEALEELRRSLGKDRPKPESGV